MNFSRQALLGVAMIVGGSVMLYAMVQQISTSDNSVITSAIVDTETTEQASVAPLTTDIDTETRLLEQKQKERALRVAEQERRAEQFMAEQESAEAQALAKSRAENQQYIDNTTPVVTESTDDDAQSAPTTPTVQQRTVGAPAASNTTTNSNINTAETQRQATEAKRVAERNQQAAAQKQAQEAAAEQKAQAAQVSAQNSPPTAPAEYQVKAGDGLIKLARQYNVPVAALAQANNTSPTSALQLGQTITIPSRRQIERLEREAVAAEQVREEQRQKEQALARKSTDAKRDAQQKLSDARREVKETDAQGSFGVQVALANDQKRADEMVKEFKSAGYQAKTSATSRGVRVIVGPERGKVAALALKDKINSDPELNTTSAWVLYWR